MRLVIGFVSGKLTQHTGPKEKAVVIRINAQMRGGGGVRRWRVVLVVVVLIPR